MVTRAIHLIRFRTDMSLFGLIVSLFRLFHFGFCGILFVFLSRLLISFTSGASSPGWVKPAAEGGGLLVFCVQIYLLAFSDLRLSYMFAVLFCLHSHYG
jgi:hypothetical protein